MGDQHVGRISRGGGHIAAGGGHAGNDSTDRRFCRVSQIAPGIHCGFNGALNSCRRSLDVIDSDRRGAYDGSLDGVPASIFKFCVGLSGAPDRASHHVPDGRRGNCYNLLGPLNDPDNGIFDKRLCLAAYFGDRLHRAFDGLSRQVTSPAAN